MPGVMTTGDRLAAEALECLRRGALDEALDLHRRALGADVGPLALAYLEPLLHAIRLDWRGARAALAEHADEAGEPTPADLGEMAIDLAAPRLAYRIGGGSRSARSRRAARALWRRTPRPACSCGFDAVREPASR